MTVDEEKRTAQTQLFELLMNKMDSQNDRLFGDDMHPGAIPQIFRRLDSIDKRLNALNDIEVQKERIMQLIQEKSRMEKQLERSFSHIREVEKKMYWLSGVFAVILPISHYVL